MRIGYDRYKEVHELAVSGELGIRKHQSFEYLMNSAATILNGTQKVFVDLPRELRVDVKENYEDFVEGMRENYEDFLDEVKVNIQDIKDNVEDFKNDIRDDVENLKSNINEGLGKIKENLTSDYSDEKYDDN